MRSHGRKDVSTMKGAAQRLTKILLRGDVKNSVISFLLEDVTKYAVIRSDKKVATGGYENRFSSRTHSGVNYREMNRPWCKGSVAAQKDEGSSFDILGRYFVRDIDE